MAAYYGGLLNLGVETSGWLRYMECASGKLRKFTVEGDNDEVKA